MLQLEQPKTCQKLCQFYMRQQSQNMQWSEKIGKNTGNQKTCLSPKCFNLQSQGETFQQLGQGKTKTHIEKTRHYIQKFSLFRITTCKKSGVQEFKVVYDLFEISEKSYKGKQVKIIFRKQFIKYFSHVRCTRKGLHRSHKKGMKQQIYLC